MKINMPELIHYIIGGLALIISTPFLMQYIPISVTTGFGYLSQLNFWLFSGAWILWYIIVDQILHKVVKHENISIIK